MKKSTRAGILTSYDENASLYEDLSTTAAQLVGMLLRQEGVALHSITHRMKTRQSLEGKISRPGKGYESIADITDVAAIRLTTYFSDDIDHVAKVIERELQIDEGASIDRRRSAEPDRFGYQSLHYIAQFTSHRCGLPEYRRFLNLRFEIQIRSILQHAWAEIEHDLGYKSATGIPYEVRRRFARVASLLELADSEFAEIRASLASYEQKLPARIRADPADVSLDLPTLRLLLESEPSLTALDQAVCDAAGGYLEGFSPVTAESAIKNLEFFGLSKVTEVRAAANSNLSEVAQFAKYWVRQDELGSVHLGIGLFYLAYVMAWRTQDAAKIGAYLEQQKIGDPDERSETVREILSFNPRSAIEG